MARVRARRRAGSATTRTRRWCYALEHFDPSTQTAHKADIFTERVVAPRTPRLGADTPADALAICLDSHGEVDLDEIARLLGVDEAAARTGWASWSSTTRPPAGWCPRRSTCPATCGTSSQHGPAGRRAPTRGSPVNVEALHRVLPRDLAPGEIEARLGAVVDRRAATCSSSSPRSWKTPPCSVEHRVRVGVGGRVRRDGQRAGHHHGGAPDSCPAPGSAQCAAQSEIVVRDTVVVDRRRRRRQAGPFNVDETIAAQEKADEMAERFADWVWEDPPRSAELVARLQHALQRAGRCAATTARAVPARPGAVRSSPGRTSSPRSPGSSPSRRSGCATRSARARPPRWRSRRMELRRLGLVRKPAIVVPNHMLEQFTREFLQLYPRAKLLAASTRGPDPRPAARVRRPGRHRRLGRGHHDPRARSRRIPMSPQAQARLPRRREIGELARGHRAGRSAKRQPARASSGWRRCACGRRGAAQGQARHRPRTRASPSSMTGIDYLFVDEAHGYKNLRTAVQHRRTCTSTAPTGPPTWT